MSHRSRSFGCAKVTAGAALLAAVLFAGGGCGSTQHPAGCGPADEAALDAWYQAQLVQHCSAYAPTATPETSCPKWQELTDEYHRRNEEMYLRCHP